MGEKIDWEPYPTEKMAKWMCIFQELSRGCVRALVNQITTLNKLKLKGKLAAEDQILVCVSEKL